MQDQFHHLNKLKQMESNHRLSNTRLKTKISHFGQTYIAGLSVFIVIILFAITYSVNV